MFAFIQGVLLRPLPVPKQDRLIFAWKALPTAGSAHWPFRASEIDAAVSYYDHPTPPEAINPGRADAAVALGPEKVYLDVLDALAGSSADRNLMALTEWSLSAARPGASSLSSCPVLRGGAAPTILAIYGTDVSRMTGAADRAIAAADTPGPKRSSASYTL
jgi:hypothetical protein